ncbi:hypothetical protein EMIHUDRAFT_449693 [Emiliania huxleyi CCMP1516]|uniref:HIT-type domain-containing protein n=2 Tax=Emiliania huxleyi TaxID=2903 RepID=A0A0D3K5Y9_EMIH1|nr:hypothetical protein EMIHUDRAFT_449693 [Emiliania huxleyi CCMP1516]EOD31174.1 hypothetical protein EMIHUDRAFT_449693 [Emiliania huxleyi CCMP1516]|eukprot:XP_005783603.1 hypothetical protein EMIHUDRAFT_449693 [Emiliania huxleyi CCMP1516]
MLECVQVLHGVALVRTPSGQRSARDGIDALRRIVFEAESARLRELESGEDSSEGAIAGLRAQLAEQHARLRKLEPLAGRAEAAEAEQRRCAASCQGAGTVLEQVDESEEPESEVEPAAEEPAGFLTKIKAMVSPRKDTPAEEEDEVDIEDKEGEAEVKEKPPCCKPPSCSMPKCSMPKCSMPKCSMPKCFPQCTKKVEAPAEEAV